MQTYSPGCILKASFRKTPRLKDTTLPFTTLFPQLCKVTSISEFSSVSPASLLERFVFPLYHLICQKSDMILVWMLWYCAYRPCERITSYHLSRSHQMGQKTYINAAMAVQQYHTQVESPSIKAVQFSFPTYQRIVVTDANARRRPWSLRSFVTSNYKNDADKEVNQNQGWIFTTWENRRISSLLWSHQDMERCLVSLSWCYQ